MKHSTIPETTFQLHLIRWIAERDDDFQSLASSTIENTPVFRKVDLQALNRKYQLALPTSFPEIENLSFGHMDNGKITAESLALEYEPLLTHQTVKRQGAFYTPIALVDRMIEALNRNCAFTSNTTFLDPACGSGIFLIRLIRYLPLPYLENPGSRFFALDINGEALALARLLAAGVLLERKGRSQDLFTIWKTLANSFQKGNFLISTEDLAEFPEACSENIHPVQPEFLSLNRFDVILGNPPYGLSRGEQLSAFENQILLKKFSWARSGKVNKYLLFAAQAFESVNAQGCISFVVPNAWLGINAASRLREIFLESGSIIEILQFRDRLFEKASVEVVIFLLQKNAHRPAILLSRYEQIDSCSSLQSHSIDTSICKKMLQNRIPLLWSEQTSDVIGELTAHCTSLEATKGLFKPAIALQAYANGKGTPPQSPEMVANHPFHHWEKISETCIPYLQGKDIGRYRLSWSGQYLEHGPWLAEPQDLSRFCCPRIVIREVLGSYPRLISATYLELPYLYNKSCLHIFSTKMDATRQSFLALLGILNSALASYWFHFLGQKSQRRLFPKIVNADLKRFPLPVAFNERCDELASVVDERLLAESNLEKYENKIFEISCQLYGLSKQSADHIREDRSLL